MSHRILNNAEDLDAFTALLGTLKLPVTVEWTLGRWYPFPGYERRYQITRDGRVRSLPRLVNSPAAGGQRMIRGKEITLQSVRGYWGFLARRWDGRLTTAYVHRAIATLFVPNPHGKPEVNHIDGVKTNNDPSNLEWVTHAENMHHAFVTGLASYPHSGPGEESPAAKLDWDTVGQIRALLREGHTRTSVAQRFGVTKSNMEMIASNKTWRV